MTTKSNVPFAGNTANILCIKSAQMDIEKEAFAKLFASLSQSMGNHKVLKKGIDKMQAMGSQNQNEALAKLTASIRESLPFISLKTHEIEKGLKAVVESLKINQTSI